MWILRANDFKQNPLEVNIVPSSKKSVILLSLKKLGLFWGLAMVSILIPILHFVLVPAFLIIGVYAFLSQYKNTHSLHEGSSTCPACQGRFPIKNIYIYDSKKINCELCMEQLIFKNQT